MRLTTIKFSITSITIGTVALIVALASFWGGPFAAQPTLETSLAESVSTARSAVIGALKGEKHEKRYLTPEWDIDRVIRVAIPILGVLSMLSAIVGFILKEPRRATLCGFGLGLSAIAFQFFALYIVVTMLAILILAVLVPLAAMD